MPASGTSSLQTRFVVDVICPYLELSHQDIVMSRLPASPGYPINSPSSTANGLQRLSQRLASRHRPLESPRRLESSVTTDATSCCRISRLGRAGARAGLDAARKPSGPSPLLPITYSMLIVRSKRWLNTVVRSHGRRVPGWDREPQHVQSGAAVSTDERRDQHQYI